jgi:hypothetical protein
MTKQYIAFLQSTQRLATTSPFRTTDKFVCIVPASTVRSARAKLRKLVQEQFDNDEDFRDTQSVSLLRLVEVTKIPREGTIVQHEIMIEQPTLVDATINNGVRNVRVLARDRLVWKAKSA